MMLGHKLVDVVVEAVVDGVDVVEPSVPPRPLAVTDPPLGEARHPDTISIQAVASYCPCPPFEVVSGRNHKETCAGCIVSLTTLTTSLLRASRFVSSRSLDENASNVFLASYFLL